jgi:hypothetical protein
VKRDISDGVQSPCIIMPKLASGASVNTQECCSGAFTANGDEMMVLGKSMLIKNLQLTRRKNSGGHT